MKLKNKKKGFTIVELVIVIAVIAILAAVLIPNLSRLVTKADKSAAMQEAKAAMDNDLINAEGDLANMVTCTVDSKQYYIIKDATSSTTPEAGNVILVKAANGTYTVKNSETEGTFYEAHAFTGFYTAATESVSAKYSVKITKSSTEYTCEYDFTTGAWTVNP